MNLTNPMRALRSLALVILLSGLAPAALSDIVMILQEPFPMQRLEELGRALDAARGDEAAVRSWLASGVDLDAAGELDLFYSVSREDLAVLYEALTGGADLQWQDAVWFQPDESGLLLIYRGMPMHRILYALGLTDLFIYSWGSSDVVGATVPRGVNLLSRH